MQPFFMLVSISGTHAVGWSTFRDERSRYALSWCQGTVVCSFCGVLVRRFHTGLPDKVEHHRLFSFASCIFRHYLPAISGPMSCSTTFSSLSWDQS